MKSGSGPTFADIRVKVNAMVAEVGRFEPSSPWDLSKMWQETIEGVDFIRELSDRELTLIRLRTFYLTGVHYNDNAGYVNSPPEVIEALPIVQHCVHFATGLPPQYWCDEPAPNALSRTTGIGWKDRLLTMELLRYQRTIANLYYARLIPWDAEKRRVYFEIGGGYGGLAHQILRAVGKAGVYVIVDLPHILFWSAVYLRLNNPDKRIYVFDRETFDLVSLDRIIEHHDIVLLPHYLLGEIDDFPRIDCALNLLSFQEMTVEQVRTYCRFLSKHLDGWLYSDNFSRHHHNTEMPVDLFDIFAEFFTTYPNYNLATHPDLGFKVYRLYPYLATPKAAPAPLNPIIRLLRGDDFEIRY